MAGGGLPVVDPLLLDAVGLLDDFVAWFRSVFYQDGYAGVEFSLGVIDVG